MRKSTALITLGICLILCGGLFPAVAWIACYFMPREYTSVAVIDVKPKPNQHSVVPFGPEPSPNIDPHFIPDQIQILQSKAILYPAIDELNLVDKWSASLPAKLSKEEAYQTLLKMIRVGQGKFDTALNIAVTSTDKQEAADIANTIAIIYKNRGVERLKQQITNALSEISATVDKQREIVEQAKDELERIRTRDNVQDPNPDQVDESNVPVQDPEYEAARKKYLDAKKLSDAAEQKYEADKMDLDIEFVPVEIWERAVPTRGPLSPNVPHIMMAATGLGLLCALCGLGLLVMGLRLKRLEAACSNLKS